MDAADRIMAAVIRILEEKNSLTYDLGGGAATSEMADAIITAMK